jgi:hypothetical protein
MTWSELDIVEDGQPVRGSEGIVLRDCEHDLGARIILECGANIPFAITCGIYGWMVHTRFFTGEADAQEQFVLMRDALDTIVNRIPLADDPLVEQKMRHTMRDITEFVERFP